MTHTPPDPPKAPALPRSRQVQLLAAAGLVLVVIVGASLGIRAISNRAEPAPTPAPAGTFTPTDSQWTALTIAPVAAFSFQDGVRAEGKIAPDEDRSSPVFSQYSGRVTQLIAEPGDEVRKGQPLFKLDASEYVQARSDLATASAGDATAQAQLRLARETEARQSELYKSGGGALKDWRQAQTDLAAADGAAEAAHATLAAARRKLAILDVSPGPAGAHAASISADSAQAVVAAPINGVVAKRSLAPGQFITAGGDAPLFVITDPSSVWLVAQVRESDAAKVRVGAPVQVTTPAYPGRVFAARIGYVAQTLDPDTHRLPVRAVIANPDGALKPEMFASFDIASGAPVTGPGIPEDAVIREGDAARVWVVGPGKSLRLRPIRIGIARGGVVQVLDGLRTGERLVTRGALFIDRAGRPQ